MIARYPCLMLALVAAGCPAPVVEESPPPEFAREMSAASRFVPARPPGAKALLEAPARVVGATPGQTALTVLHPAKIIRFHVAPGDRVEAGAPVADLVIPAVTEAAVQAGGLAARLRATRSRIKALSTLKAEGLARADQLYELRARAARLDAELRAARAVLQTYDVDDAGLAKIRETGQVVLRSPEAGVVITRHRQTGAAIELATEPVAVVAGPRPARIEASVVSTLPTGFRLVFTGQDGRALTLNSEPIASYRDGRSGRVTVWLEPETPVALSDEMPGRLWLSPPANAVEVPSRAIDASADGHEVAVLEAERTRRVAVEVLFDSGTSAVVLGAIRPGDLVASDVSEVAP